MLPQQGKAQGQQGRQRGLGEDVLAWMSVAWNVEAVRGPVFVLQVRHSAHALEIRAMRTEPALRDALRDHPCGARHWGP